MRSELLGNVETVVAGRRELLAVAFIEFV